MTTTLALAPLLLVLGLLASGRVGALMAGLAGLAATLAVSGMLLWPDGGAAADRADIGLVEIDELLAVGEIA